MNPVTGVIKRINAWGNRCEDSFFFIYPLVGNLRNHFKGLANRWLTELGKRNLIRRFCIYFPFMGREAFRDQSDLPIGWNQRSHLCKCNPILLPNAPELSFSFLLRRDKIFSFTWEASSELLWFAQLYPSWCLGFCCCQIAKQEKKEAFKTLVGSRERRLLFSSAVLWFCAWSNLSIDP